MPTLPTLNVLHRAEFPGNYATVMVLIENVDGAPRHTHPGLEMTYILEGEFNLMVDGRPDQPLKPGDWFEVPAEVQRYLVNGHPATAREEQVLASYGFDAGAWRMDGWGISLDVAHANFVPEPRLPQCHYVLGVPLDCDGVQIAAR